MKTEKRKRYEAAYRRKNRKRLRAKFKEYYRNNAAKIRAKHTVQGKARRLRTYGLTAEAEAKMLADQNNACAICRGTVPKSNGGKTWIIDHDHVTGHVRGLLCQACNLVLGHAKDSIAVLRQAIYYLQNSQKSAKLLGE